MPSPIDLGPKPNLAYANSPLERAAEQRGDDAVLASLRQAETCLHYVVGGEWVVLKKTSNGLDPAFSFSEIGALANDVQTPVPRVAGRRRHASASGSIRNSPKA